MVTLVTDPNIPAKLGLRDQFADEPVSRWENEGGATAERGLTGRAAGEILPAPDGDATRRE